MKPKREITLGEMQDECKFRGDNCETIGGDKCKFFELCASMQTIDKGCLTPIMWNLTDPPRFTEAQMALLKALWDFGIRSASNCGGGDIYFYRLESEPVLAVIDTRLLDENDIDLAELFGKEGNGGA